MRLSSIDMPVAAHVPGRRGLALRIASWSFSAVAPLAVVAAQLSYLRAVSYWIQEAPARPGSWALGLALPPILAELAFTRVFEVRARSWRGAVVAGLVSRVLFLVLLSLLFVHIPLRSKGTDDSLPFQFWMWPVPVRLAWLASPPAAVLLGLACAAAYGFWTVRARKARLTTTVVLPGLATVALAMLLYYFPAAPLRGLDRRRPAFVTRVFAPEAPNQRFPREVHVTGDERLAVMSFGTSFPFFQWGAPFDSSAPSSNELGLDTTRCGEGACRKNLVLIDLTTGERRSFPVPPVRHFHADAGWPVFVVPWHVSDVLELGIDGSIRKHVLPNRLDGMDLVEPMFSYEARDLERLFVLYALNPAVLSWNTRTRSVDRIVPLAGEHGVHLGEQDLSVARNPSRHCLYLLMSGIHHQILEMDERDLTVRRALELPSYGFDIGVSPDGQTLFVPSFFTREMWRIDAGSLTVRETLDAPLHTRRVGFSLDGSKLFAASFATGELRVYDARTGRVRTSFYVAPRLEGLDVAGTGLYLLSADGLFRVPLDGL